MGKRRSKETEEAYCNFCGNSGTNICRRCTEVFNEETQKYLAPTQYEHYEPEKAATEGLLCADCKYMSVNRIDDPCRECIENFAKTGESINFCTRNVNPVPKFVDNVNHPSHYADSTSIECIESMELTFGTELVYHFAVGNAYKYLWRHKNKGKVEEDLNKANWYYHKAKRLLEKGKEEVVVYPYEERQLSILKFYINDYACRAGIQLKEVHFSDESTP